MELSKVKEEIQAWKRRVNTREEKIESTREKTEDLLCPKCKKLYEEKGIKLQRHS